MDFNRALEISGRFQDAYDTLLRINGSELEERAKPFLSCIKSRCAREKCLAVEAVLIILVDWYNSTRIPLSAMTMWLLASAVILEKAELQNYSPGLADVEKR